MEIEPHPPLARGNSVEIDGQWKLTVEIQWSVEIAPPPPPMWVVSENCCTRLMHKQPKYLVLHFHLLSSPYRLTNRYCWSHLQRKHAHVQTTIPIIERCWPTPAFALIYHLKWVRCVRALPLQYLNKHIPKCDLISYQIVDRCHRVECPPTKVSPRTFHPRVECPRTLYPRVECPPDILP